MLGGTAGENECGSKDTAFHKAMQRFNIKFLQGTFGGSGGCPAAEPSIIGRSFDTAIFKHTLPLFRTLGKKGRRQKQGSQAAKCMRNAITVMAVYAIGPAASATLKTRLITTKKMKFLCQ